MLLAKKPAEPHYGLSKCLITRQHVVICMTRVFLLRFLRFTCQKDLAHHCFLRWELNSAGWSGWGLDSCCCRPPKVYIWPHLTQVFPLVSDEIQTLCHWAEHANIGFELIVRKLFGAGLTWIIVNIFGLKLFFFLHEAVCAAVYIQKGALRMAGNPIRQIKQ